MITQWEIAVRIDRDSWDQIQSLETDSHIYVHLLYNKGTQARNGGKVVLITK